MQQQSIHVLFGWTEQRFSKSNHHVLAASLFFVQLNDPSMFCNHFMGAFRNHSSTRFVTSKLAVISLHLMTGKLTLINLFYTKFK